ncbi:MAG: hypothetical protein DWQ30_18265 [Acidobacteria bacterium]|nr:MAG: hypothetical protein DWQ30_18265 [Acidobacteriota bacterium]
MTDGTRTGTRPLTTGGALIGAADDNVYFHQAGALWRSDGTAEGTRQVATDWASAAYDLDGGPLFLRSGLGVPLGFHQLDDEGGALLPVPGDWHSICEILSQIDGLLYFTARSAETSSCALWRTDGTLQQTVALSEPGEAWDDLWQFQYWIDKPGRIGLSVNGRFLMGCNGLCAVALDGSAVEPLVDQTGEPFAPNVEGSIQTGSHVFLAADREDVGWELWITDLLAGGTELFDYSPGGYSSDSWIAALVSAGGRAYFAAPDARFGRELWTSDGTRSGTRLAVESKPGIDSFSSYSTYAYQLSEGASSSSPGRPSTAGRSGATTSSRSSTTTSSADRAMPGRAPCRELTARVATSARFFVFTPRINAWKHGPDPSQDSTTLPVVREEPRLNSVPPHEVRCSAVAPLPIRLLRAGVTTTLGLLAVLVVAPSSTAQSATDPSLTDDGPWIVRAAASPGDRDLLGAVAGIVGHLKVEDDGALLLHVDDAFERDRLLALGVVLELDRAETDRVRGILEQLRGGAPLRTIPGFSCYRTVEETLARGAQIAADHPTLATWTDLGDSWEKQNPGNGGDGYDLFVLRLTNAAIAGPKPDFVVLGGLHAREYTTAELATRFAELLIDGYGVDADATWLLDHHEIHLVLQVNPDGRKRAESGLLWRKNANNDHCGNTNDRGIDLNRNFDFEWGCCGGSSGSACSTSFRGPSARSEPEAIVVMDYMDGVFPDQRPDDQVTAAPLDSEGLFIDLHSFGEVVLSSWGFTTTPPPNGQGILTLARKYAYFPDYFAQLGSLGTVDGATKDYAYGRLGVPGYTVELGTTFFQSCTDFENQIAPDNLDALLHIAKNVRTPYVTPSGPDAYDLALSAASVHVGEPVTLSATVDDTRYDSLAEPRQNVAAAELYVDTPPWDGGTPLAMLPGDGLFDATIEGVELELDTSALAPGQHILFVRGQDADGNFGAPSAIFLDVDDGSIFADGFESGDTTSWSSATGAR